MSQLVSILIPCYNAARYVGAALDSALAQTWQEKEVIVVNDGSTDDSGRILNSYRARRVKVIDQDNRGQSAAVNRAFAECRGDYIKFCDADDLMNPRMIELQLERLSGSASAVASAEWGRFYKDDLDTFRLDPQAVWRDMDSREWLVESLLSGGGMMQCALFLMPRELLDRSGLWNEQLSLINDFEFFARVLCNASQVLFTPGAQLYYRSGIRGSVSGYKSWTALESAFHSLMWGTGHLLAKRQDARAREACATVLQKFIYDYYPDEAAFRAKVLARVKELGGSRMPPDGPPRFQQLRRVVGWKVARRIERIATRHGLNAAALNRRSKSF